MIVPIDLQPVIGKKEFRYSLKTGYLRVANSKARLTAGWFQSLFRKIREVIELREFTDFDIGNLVNSFDYQDKKNVI